MYKRLLILDLSGVSGESVYVEYRILSVHDGVRFVLSGTQLIHNSTKQIEDCIPVLVDLSKVILVAALEFPKISFVESDEHRPFPTLHEQLVILLQLLSRALRFQSRVDIVLA